MIFIKRIITIVAFVYAASALGGVADDPDITLLDNQYLALFSVNEYIVALTPYGVATLEQDAPSGFYNVIERLYLAGKLQSAKISGDILAARYTDDRIGFVNIADPSNLTFLGETASEETYSDYALLGSDLFLSHFFSGVSRWQVRDWSWLDLIEVDSSAVVATQLEARDQYLYILDNYNGILRHDLSVGSLGDQIDSMLIPRRPETFSLVDSLVIVGLNGRGAYFGAFGSGLIDSLMDIPSPVKAIGIDDRLILLDSRSARVVDRQSFSLYSETALTERLIHGDVIYPDGLPELALPDSSGGLTGLNPDDLSDRRSLLERSGPITDLALDGNLLLATVATGSLDAFEIVDSQVTVQSSFWFEQGGALALAISGRTVFALCSNGEIVYTFDKSDLSAPGDSLVFEQANAKGLVYLELGTCGAPILGLIERSSLRLINLNDPTPGQGQSISFASPIASVGEFDGRLVVSTYDNSIHIYRLSHTGTFIHEASATLDNVALTTVEHAGSLLVLSENMLSMFYMRGHSHFTLDTSMVLPIPAHDAAVVGDRLYTVGPDGIVVYDLSGGLSTMIESGSVAGHKIIAGSGCIATTDGGAVHVYLVDTTGTEFDSSDAPTNRFMLHAWPNPFNDIAGIRFCMPATAQAMLVVHNIRGQQVRRLASNQLSVGEHFVQWNGKSDAGGAVASGVYFIRLTVGSEAETIKVILLK